jgi:leucyl aminopeptidase
MQWTFVTGSPSAVKAEGLIVGVFEDLNFKAASLPPSVAADAARLRFKGQAGESFYAFNLFGRPAKHLLVVGLGKRGALTPAVIRSASALGIKRLRDRFLATAAIQLPIAQDTPNGRHSMAQALVEGMLLANERFTAYLTDEKARFDGIKKAFILVPKRSADYESGGKLGAVLSDATLFARRLVSEPSNVLTPERMAQEARAVAKEAGFSIKVLGPKECEKLGMGAYLAVARGSRNEPRFIHLSYRPKGAKFHLGLVGKGLTFDSGGISIKPSDGMGAMKSDMAGSAAVLGAMKAIGALKPKVAVDAVMAMAENMPGGGAYRPGDVLKSMSGKTIEVLNTDAEGRLTLADALCYVQKQKVDAVVDLATLTGACVVALGPDFSGAMGNDQKLVDEVLSAARDSGDNIWQLPLPVAYNKYIRSDVADVANISRIRWGGAITAGLFLQNFVTNGTPWVHLDIAGPALRDDDGNEAYKGEGSGTGVRTLVRLVLEKEK